MNKLTIPAILVATVMVAGIFAFMPVEQASTVHLSAAFLSNQNVIKTTTDSETPTGGNAALTRTVTIDLDAPFQLLAFTVECEPGDPSTGNDVAFCEAGESMDITSIAIDGQADANVIAMNIEPGVSTDDDPTIVLSLFGVDAEATNDAIGVPSTIAAADRIVITLELDTDGIATADDSFVLTVRVTVLTAASTTLDATDITFS